MTARYRKLAEGDDPFGALPYEQMFDAIATIEAMARQMVLNGDGFPIAIDEFYEGLNAARRQVVSIQQAMAWSDYRKAFGVSDHAHNEAHKAFIAGWQFAQGKSSEGGPLR